jgi:hypothetical protein
VPRRDVSPLVSVSQAHEDNHGPPRDSVAALCEVVHLADAGRDFCREAMGRDRSSCGSKKAVN